MQLECTCKYSNDVMQDDDMGPNSVIVVFHLLFFPFLLHVYIKNLSLFQVVKILLFDT